VAHHQAAGKKYKMRGVKNNNVRTSRRRIRNTLKGMPKVPPLGDIYV